MSRLKMLLAMLQICRLLPSIASSCPTSGRDEYRLLYRPSGIEIFLEPAHVTKTYPAHQYEQAKQQAGTVYEVLRCTCSLVFGPRGSSVKPSTLAEVLCATRDILEALVKLHSISWMHRDIRWSNVVKICGNNSESWFLIDFMDAAESPQDAESAKHLSRSIHAPEMFTDPTHTTAVDIWSVGRLLKSVGDIWGDSGDRDAFVRELMHELPTQRPTAKKALARLKELGQQYIGTWSDEPEASKEM
ncbi:hypothetical protein PHYSODRAFT_307775 [Phytophthora sojae]|uniref:non-specific serine/threonine protein kinase n=1 Tax=Phytophthora sojae (strain P6497) TaxID=1094619 RepID=G5AG05_PHYSP|nr:hypothetical protein PHYSODRAFT_307775 [Phytophthora sojae]EGZ05517.1 hypothetical protein PHYSODRAFT_307775 [Phytophthora sojae]|eukprot:XP_009539048.1 hypothetical protein PHYSODRAFT_307775 [Phytophthora sojae]